MSETAILGLPLLAPAQAQKHVTVNEALGRIDALAQLVIRTQSLTAPPAAPAEGDCHAVPVGATGLWAGQEGRLAICRAGGWDFIAPRNGWRGFILELGQEAVFAGGAWQTGVMAASPFGALARWRVIEFEHAVTAGASNTTIEAIPSAAMVFGVSARVVTAITGTLTSWQLGQAGSTNRFGSGLGKGAGSYATGMLGAPAAYLPASLLLTATGGSFAAGGVVRIAAHVLELTPPAT